MFLKAEVINGDVYMLTERGEIWRMKMGNDDQPIIEMLDDVGHDRARYICDYAMSQWVNR